MKLWDLSDSLLDRWILSSAALVRVIPAPRRRPAALTSIITTVLTNPSLFDSSTFRSCLGRKLDGDINRGRQFVPENLHTSGCSDFSLFADSKPDLIQFCNSVYRHIHLIFTPMHWNSFLDICQLACHETVHLLSLRRRI